MTPDRKAQSPSPEGFLKPIYEFIISINTSSSSKADKPPKDFSTASSEPNANKANSSAKSWTFSGSKSWKTLFTFL